MKGTYQEGKIHDAKIQPLGPVGMLIQELNNNCAVIDEHLNIKQDNEMDINVIDTPWATLQDLTEGFAKRARIQRASDNRKFLGGINEMDHITFQKAVAKRTKEEMGIISYVTTDACWSRDKLEEIGRAEDELCTLCSKPEHDIRHTLWDCSCIFEGDGLEKRQKLKELLPRNLQHGIPSMLVKNLDTTFWGLTKEKIQGVDDELLNLMGIRSKINARNRQVIANYNAEKIYSKRGMQSQKYNARQIFQQIKGTNVNADFAKVSQGTPWT